jgi:AcrR family transcriptional regulator
VAEPRPRTLEPDVRKGEILRAAAEVFAAKGFHVARIADVAERAGVAQGTIYRFFESKEDLARTLLLSGASFLRTAALEAMQQAQDAGDPAGALELFIHNAAQFYERHRGELLALHSWSLDPSAREYVAGVDDELAKQLRRLVQLARDRIRPLPGVDVARLLLLLLYSLSSQLEHYGAANAGARTVEQIIGHALLAEPAG